MLSYGFRIKRNVVETTCSGKGASLEYWKKKKKKKSNKFDFAKLIGGMLADNTTGELEIIQE